MKKPGRFFFVVESLLLLLIIWQLIDSPLLLTSVIGGVFLIYMALHSHRRRQNKRRNNVPLFLGIFLILIGLLYNSGVWIMLIFTILFVGLKGVEISGVDLSHRSFWQKKQMLIVESKEPENHDGRKRKQQWIGNERIGDQVYEWDDININVLSGDTIIDLGNTILPKKENVVLIRKGLGRTRVLIPSGIGVQLEHTALLGNVFFEDEEIKLRNDILTLYSQDYSESARQVKLITNTLIGDIEVIRV